MKVIKLQVDGFKNLKQIEIHAHAKRNIILGENGQGKTNLIEALWLFTGQKSFRYIRENPYIGLHCERANMKLTFEDMQRSQTAEMMLTKQNKNDFYLNRVPLKNMHDYLGKFHAVVFSPVHLKIIQSSPVERRQFLNQAISQIRLDYYRYYRQYMRILQQRNKILKEQKNEGLLSIYDEQLSQIGCIISLMLFDYIKKLRKYVIPIYREISGEREILEISYHSTIYEKMEDSVYHHQKKEQYLSKLKENINTDMQYKTTSVGIHRDDLNLWIDGKDIRKFGSQGQQRSCVIALKLAEAKILEEATGERPIILLDDVMSELDKKRQQYIGNYIKDHQLFISCCNQEELMNIGEGNIYEIKDGNLTCTSKLEKI